MELVIETDLGHDPDDLFAILWLAAVGVKVAAITVVPGDPDQIAIARFLCKELDWDIPIGASSLTRTKNSSGGIHHELLSRYKFPLAACPDDSGDNIIRQVAKKDTEFLVIGPVTSVGRWLQAGNSVERATMQGGFVPYHVHHTPCRRLPQFEGRNHVPSFNLNGDRQRAKVFIEANIKEKRFVSKNICHGIIYSKEIHRYLKPRNRPSHLFKEAMDLMFEKHDYKKFHDPTAAVCHMWPEIASWERGKVMKAGDGWTTILDPTGDFVITDIREDLLWDHLLNFQ